MFPNILCCADLVSYDALAVAHLGRTPFCDSYSRIDTHPVESSMTLRDVEINLMAGRLNWQKSVTVALDLVTRALDHAEASNARTTSDRSTAFIHLLYSFLAD
jgi:hypothetical protein